MCLTTYCIQLDISRDANFYSIFAKLNNQYNSANSELSMN